MSTGEGLSDSDSKSKFEVDKRTRAEIAFNEAKEKRAIDQIMNKASKSHKERIMVKLLTAVVLF